MIDKIRFFFLLKVYLLIICFYPHSNLLCLNNIGTDTREIQGEKYLEVLHAQQQNNLYHPQDAYFNNLLLDEAIKQNNIKYQAIALTNRVAYYQRIFDSDSIFYHAKIAENFASTHQLDEYLFTIKQIVIQRYLDQGNYNLGLQEAIKMNNLTLNNDNPEMEATALFFLAKVYQALGQSNEAIECMKKSRVFLEKKYEHIPKTLDYYLFVSDLYEDLEIKDSVSVYTDSLSTLIQITELKYSNYNLDDFKIGCHLNSAYYYIENREFDKAWGEIEKADSVISSSNNPFFLFLSETKKMKYFHAVKEYDKMNYYYRNSFNYCKKHNLSRGIKFLLRFYAVALGERGRHNEAVAMYKELENYTDSINMQQFIYETNRLSIEYELDKREDQIRAQKSELEIKSLWLIILSVISIAAIAITFFIIRYTKIIKKKNKRLFNQIIELNKAKEELVSFKECIKERIGMNIDCPKKKDSLFEEVKEFMENEKPYINSEYGRKNLISDMHTNEVYLSRAIKNGANMTIQEYINSWRTEYAKQILLQDMNTTIESAALDAGFSSTRNFYRLFKDTYSMSPNEFRNYVKKNYKT